MGDTIRYPNMGTVKKGRCDLRPVTGLHPAAVQDGQNPLCERRAHVACQSGQSGPVL